MIADRNSQSISSNGSTPSFANARSYSRPATDGPGPKVRPTDCDVVSTCARCIVTLPTGTLSNEPRNPGTRKPRPPTHFSYTPLPCPQTAPLPPRQPLSG